jgi:hypothetical protein
MCGDWTSGTNRENAGALAQVESGPQTAVLALQSAMLRAGNITEFPVPTSNSSLDGIAAGLEGNF